MRKKEQSAGTVKEIRNTVLDPENQTLTGPESSLKDSSHGTGRKEKVRSILNGSGG